MALQPLRPSDQHRLAQVGLTVAAGAAIRKALASVDVHSLKATLPDFTAQIAAIVRHYAPAASTLAVRHYAQQRAEAGVPGTFHPKPAALVPLDQIASNVRWATGPLWGKQPDMATTQTNVEGAVGKLLLDVGRNTVIDNADRDRTIVGWAREARPNACWFCAMLATRGAVYSTPGAAGRIAASDPLDKGGLGIPDAQGFVNRFHDHCHCTVVPVFNTYEKQAHVRDWTALWNSSTAGVTGMKAKQDAFKAALAAQRGH